MTDERRGPETEEFLGMVKYFWQEKGDPTRYVFFDIDRLKKEAPAVAYAWENYKNAKLVLETLIEQI